MSKLKTTTEPQTIVVRVPIKSVSEKERRQALQKQQRERETLRQMSAAERALAEQAANKVDPRDIGLAHSIRFRTFGNAYPRAVSMAYDGDLHRAMRSTDKQVARMVLKWVRRTGLPLRGWQVAVRVANGQGK